MITENQRLAMDYRDAGLWKYDHPTAYGNIDNRKCSKCGESVSNGSTVDVDIPGAHGTEHYKYHKQCVKYLLKAKKGYENPNLRNRITQIEPKIKVFNHT